MHVIYIADSNSEVAHTHPNIHNVNTKIYMNIASNVIPNIIEPYQHTTL